MIEDLNLPPAPEGTYWRIKVETHPSRWGYLRTYPRLKLVQSHKKGRKKIVEKVLAYTDLVWHPNDLPTYARRDAERLLTEYADDQKMFLFEGTYEGKK